MAKGYVFYSLGSFLNYLNEICSKKAPIAIWVRSIRIHSTIALCLEGYAYLIQIHEFRSRRYRLIQWPASQLEVTSLNHRR